MRSGELRPFRRKRSDGQQRRPQPGPTQQPEPRVTDASVAQLIEFLPQFERGDFAGAVTHYHETGQYVPEVYAFFKVLEAGRLGVENLDVIAWKKGEGTSILTDEGMAKANFLQLRKVLTYCATADRFNAGLLPKVFASGLIEAALRRMSQLRAEVQKPVAANGVESN